MSTVLHYLQRWLPLSEQYVDGLIRRSRHRGVVVARHFRENIETFPYEPVVSLGWVPLQRWPAARVERILLDAGLLAVAVKHRVDLVHHHHGYRLGDAEDLVRMRRLPYVVSVHGHDVTSFIHDMPEYSYARLRRADAVVVPSDFLVPFVTGTGVSAERVRVIPAGVDLRWFTPQPLPSGPPLAVFVGRFVEKKGIDVLLEAWRHVAEKVPEARLLLVGHGPLLRLARSGGSTVEVERTDPTRRAAQVRDALRRARLVVTPSRTAADGDAETLLLVNLEAQATGRPVVSTRHGGIPEFVVDGETGLLVPEADPRALADALVELLTDDGLAARLGSAGAAWVQRFDVDACTARVDDLYDELIAR
jgi:glycosyltransferase involved in cell wall biosynthesis